MLSRREYLTAQLNAVHQAKRALRDLAFEEADWIDPFVALERAGALLVFRPLQGLCGAYLPKPDGGDAAGVFISTHFPLSVQRFTAAHELGHLWMQHAPSLDREEDILPRAASDRLRDHVGNPAQEVAAEAFAGHFLMPRAKVIARMTALGITEKDLRSAEAIYRLSLWFGTSFQAMVWHLVSLKLLTTGVAAQLAPTRPKSIKQALGGIDALVDWRNDVWSLTARESGQHLHARIGDTLAIHLPSHATSGYLWDAGDIDPETWELVRIAAKASPTPARGRATPQVPDAADLFAGTQEVSAVNSVAELRPLGQAPQQVAVMRVRRDGAHPLSLAERRPWSPTVPAAEFRLTVVVEAPFAPGLASARRKQHLGSTSTQ